MWDATRSDENHAVSGVVILDIVGEIGSVNLLDVLCWAKDGASKSLSLEGSRVEVIENNLLQLLVDLLGFAEDNITLAVDCGLLELGVLKNVGKNVDGSGDIRVEGLGVVDGVLAL